MRSGFIGQLAPRRGGRAGGVAPIREPRRNTRPRRAFLLAGRLQNRPQLEPAPEARPGPGDAQRSGLSGARFPAFTEHGGLYSAPRRLRLLSRRAGSGFALQLLPGRAPCRRAEPPVPRLCPSARAAARQMPALKVTVSACPASAIGVAATPATIRSAIGRACSAVVSGSRRMNSSPPRRAMTSAVRVCAAAVRPISANTSSPAACPSVSLICLKWSTSIMMMASARSYRTAAWNSRVASSSK